MLLGEHLRTISLRRYQVKAVALAQAGIMRAVYDVRLNSGGNCLTLGEYPVSETPGTSGGAGDNVFILGGKAADFLMANMIEAIVSTNSLRGVGSRDRLRAWSVENVLCGNAPPGGLPVQVTHIAVAWANPAAGEGVIRIEIPAGTRIWPASGTASAPQPSGTLLDVTDTTIPPDAARTGVIWFSTTGVLTGSTKWPIDVTVQMSDHAADAPNRSLRIGRYAGALSERSGSFTVKSAGEIRRAPAPFTVWRRLQAEYRMNDDDGTTNIQEIGNLTSDPNAAAGRPGYHELTWKTP